MKRFTETTEWDKEWFRNLPPAYKLLWRYIRDKCDAAGVWRVDFGLASFQIGETVDADEALRLFNDNPDEARIEALGKTKWWIVGFVSFQYGTLTEKCAPHRKIIQLLHNHGLTARVGLG